METRTIALGVILGTGSIANVSIKLSFGELFLIKQALMLQIQFLLLRK